MTYIVHMLYTRIWEPSVLQKRRYREISREYDDDLGVSTGPVSSGTYCVIWECYRMRTCHALSLPCSVVFGVHLHTITFTEQKAYM